MKGLAKRRPTKPASRAFFWLFAGLFAALPGTGSEGAEILVSLDYAYLPEASGLAPSQREEDRIWAINDSGNGAELIAVGLSSGSHHVMTLPGVRNRDWEDLAAFSLAGQPWLAIGDIGDNGGRRSQLRVHLLPEPEEPLPESVPVHSTLTLRYPDGARDAEALAVDSITRTLYILSKRDALPRLYRAPIPALEPNSEHELVLEFLGEVTSIPPPTAEERRALPFGRFRAQPTGMDASIDQPTLVLLTYGRAYRASLDENRDWLRALNTQLCPKERVELKQAESITIDTRGRILLSSEGRDAPLVRINPACQASP